MEKVSLELAKIIISKEGACIGAPLYCSNLLLAGEQHSIYTVACNFCKVYKNRTNKERVEICKEIIAHNSCFKQEEMEL